jgi:hypothetical protein
MPKLTKRVVEAAQPSGRDYFIWCDELPGFGLRVFASEKRSYLVQYRAGGRRVTIGPHGPVTPEQARKQALALLGEIARGGNPAEDRANQRDAVTVKDLCADYLPAMERGLVMGKGGRPKKESTLYVDRGRIERHIIPLLGRRLVKDLTRSDIERFIRDVTAGKTAGTVKTGKLRGKAVVEGGAGTAARTAGLLGGTLTFAISEGLIASNPATGVKRPADKRRQRRLTPQEYGKLGHALQCAAKEGETPQAITGAWLLTLTGAVSERSRTFAGMRLLPPAAASEWKTRRKASQCVRLETLYSSYFNGWIAAPTARTFYQPYEAMGVMVACPERGSALRRGRGCRTSPLIS